MTNATPSNPYYPPTEPPSQFIIKAVVTATILIGGLIRASALIRAHRALTNDLLSAASRPASELEVKSLTNQIGADLILARPTATRVMGVRLLEAEDGQIFWNLCFDSPESVASSIYKAGPDHHLARNRVQGDVAHAAQGQCEHLMSTGS